MRRLLRTVLVCAVVLAAIGPMPDARAGRVKEVENEAYTAEFRAHVRQAIQRGIQYLQEEQMAAWGFIDERHAFREAAAVHWVLRRAGVPLDDPATQYQFRILYERPPRDVDDLCMLLLALCAEPLPEGDPFSIPGGESDPPPAASLSEKDRVRATKMVETLLGLQQMERTIDPALRDRLPESMVRNDPYGGWTMHSQLERPVPAADVMGTSMSVLALEAAARCGIDVPPKRFHAALGYLMRAQAQKGRRTTLLMNEVRGTKRRLWKVKAQARGFGNRAQNADEPTGYESAAGAIGLVVCLDALRDEDTLGAESRKKALAAVHDALAWIQKHYTIESNPDPKRSIDAQFADLFHHRWLQGLARLAIHNRMRFIGKHDWYREGAELLLKEQRENGSWQAIWWENCYALLFLQRASLSSVAPVITPSEH